MNMYQWAVPPKTAHVLMLQFENSDLDESNPQGFWHWAKTSLKGKVHVVNTGSGWTVLNSKELPRDDYTCPFHGASYINQDHEVLTMVLIEDADDAMLARLRWA